MVFEKLVFFSEMVFSPLGGRETQHWTASKNVLISRNNSIIAFRFPGIFHFSLQQDCSDGVKVTEYSSHTKDE